MRTGKSSVALSANEIRSLVKKYSLPDFDTQFIDKQHNIDIQLAQKISYSVGAKMMIGEYLCLATHELNQINFYAKAGLFKGNNMTTVLDMKDFKQNLIQQSEDLLEYIKRQINMKVIITGASKRTELWDYPLEAIRECINNALVHRDYSDYGNIQVRIFDNTLEIWSPGLLPKEIDITNLLRFSRSVPRNKKIAEIFYKAGIIEHWGSGFQRIADYCKANNNPLPIWKKVSGAFVTIFSKRQNEGLSEGLSEKLAKVLKTIILYPGIQSNEIALKLDIPLKSIERYIKQLIESNYIERRGSKKTGGYFRNS